MDVCNIRSKFDLETLERVANPLVQKDVLEVLPKQVEIVVELHVWSYRDEDGTDGFYHSQAKRGTTVSHLSATLSPRVKNKRSTLASCRLVDDDTANSVLIEFLNVLDGLDLSVKAIYLNHEFYGSKWLTLLQAYNQPYVMPIIR